MFDFANGKFYDALHKEKKQFISKKMNTRKGEISLPKLLYSEILFIPNIASSVFCQQRPLECPQNKVISLIF